MLIYNDNGWITHVYDNMKGVTIVESAPKEFYLKLRMWHDVFGISYEAMSQMAFYEPKVFRKKILDRRCSADDAKRVETAINQVIEANPDKYRKIIFAYMDEQRDLVRMADKLYLNGVKRSDYDQDEIKRMRRDKPVWQP